MTAHRSSPQRYAVVGNDRRKTAAKQKTDGLRSFIEGPPGFRGAYVRTEIFYAKTLLEVNEEKRVSVRI